MDPRHTCCFSGHRKILECRKEWVLRRIHDAINYLYEQGTTTFITGGALGFDTLAAEAVLAQKAFRKEISLIVVLPCASQAARWSTFSVQRYERIKAEADTVICLSERYYNGCMQARNRYMVEMSAYCVCYLERAWGGTYYTVQYAKERGVKIYNLAK